MAGFLSLSWNNHSLAFLNLLNSLHSKELYCDVTIACHGKFYPVHRMVLSTCSEYFQEIFALTQCKHPFIIVNDAQPPELEALLEYMYKGNINVPQSNLPTLLKAAEALRIKGLAVPDNITPDREVSKKRGSSQNSSSKKLKVVNKEKKNDPVRSSPDDRGRETPATIFVEDKEESSFKEESISKNEVDDESMRRLGQEDPSNSIIEPLVKHEPFDSPYSEEQVVSQDGLQYSNNTEWPISMGESNGDNQQSICGLQGMLESFSERITEIPSQETMLSMSTPLVDENSLTRLKCPYCPFWAREPHDRTKHISMKHPDYLPFGCSICGYKCLSRATLLIHVRKHTGEKPFSCPYAVCNYKSSTNSNLRRHMKIIHCQRSKSSA